MSEKSGEQNAEASDRYVFFAREAEKFPDTDIGLDVVLLLAHINSWIIRRIEKITFLDDRSVRRQITVDFSVPLEAPLRESPDNSYLIPLGLLRKAPLVGFDLRDESGAALSVLSKRENSLIAWSAACALGENILGELVPDGLSKKLHSIVSMDPDHGAQILKEVRESKNPKFKKLMKVSLFQELLQDLCNNFLLLTPVAFEPGRRRILKFSYFETVGLENLTLSQRLGLEPAPIRFSVPSIDEADSFHFEIEAPRGMDVYEAEIVELDEIDEEVDQLAYDGVRAQRVHLYPDSVPPGARAEARIWLLPVTRGFMRSAFLFSFAVAGMLLAILLRLPGDAEESVPSLLLALPGVVGLFLTRPGENPMTSRLLLGLRGVVSVVGFLPFAGALLLVLNLNQSLERWVWVGLTGAAFVASSVIGRAYAISRRP